MSNSKMEEVMNKFENEELSFEELSEMCGGLSNNIIVPKPVPVI